MINGKITITAKTEGAGLLVSLATDGDFSSESIDRRFYSVASEPPDGLPPEHFWGHLLQMVSGFLSAEE